jgi:hypothetical protein
MLKTRFDDENNLLELNWLKQRDEKYYNYLKNPTAEIGTTNSLVTISETITADEKNQEIEANQIEFNKLSKIIIELYRSNKFPLHEQLQRYNYLQSILITKLNIFSDSDFCYKANSYFYHKQIPLKAFNIIGDGNCYFRAISFLILDDENEYNTIKQTILDNMYLCTGFTHLFGLDCQLLITECANVLMTDGLSF